MNGGSKAMSYEAHREDCDGRQVIGPIDCCDETEELTAKDVMQYGVLSIERKEPVFKAVSLLLDRNIGGLAVTDNGWLVGMLSDKDLLRLVHRKEYLPGLVEDYMTSNVTTFDVDDTVSTISEYLMQSSFRRVPILYEQKPVGMITRADLIRVYKERFRPPGCCPCPTDDEVLAEDVMKHSLLTVRHESHLYDVMDMIVRHHVTGLPVVDDDMVLVGIITEKDILKCIAGPILFGATVEVAMNTNVTSFDRKTPLNRICECLIANDFHRVPIVDQGRLVGIISRSDILRKRVSSFRPPKLG
jgi:CBS domain-containing protein